MAKAPPGPRPEPGTNVDEELVRKLAKLLDETGLTEIEYGRDDWHVRVAKGARPARTAAIGSSEAASPDAIPEESLTRHLGAITAPMVGVVYHAPEPGAAPFVRVGDQVKPGQTLFLIEAMKVMNPVAATVAGRVARILVANGAPVEYDEVLALVE